MIFYPALADKCYVQNPESLSKTREPLTPGFASGFPKILGGKRLCFRKNVLKTLFPETCGFAQIALRKTLKYTLYYNRLFPPALLAAF
jgi:hypothetical protein